MESEPDILIGSIYGDGSAIRPGEGGCLPTLGGGPAGGGNILRRLSTINIFLICALLLTSKITSK